MRLSQGLLRAAVLLALASFALVTFVCAAAPDDTPYRASVEKWRQEYEASLRADYGWLSVSGLFWLHDGQNKFGSDPLNDIVLPGAPPHPTPARLNFTRAAPWCTSSRASSER